MKKKTSTIYDLAELANVSASTVSAVLNGNWRHRRIAEDTALRVQRLAAMHKYTVNRQASGLRKSRSGLIGMIIPMHDNRFFSSMSQVFERRARERHWYPIVVSTLRDPALEIETVKTLISYRIEYLIVAGATDPDSVSHACRSHGVAHVNVDLPGTRATSVISDNYWGAQQLTRALIDRSQPSRSPRATSRTSSAGSLPITRRDVASRASPKRSSHASARSNPARSTPAVTRRFSPRRQCIASTRDWAGCRARCSSIPRSRSRAWYACLKSLPPAELQHCTFGCYDWDPFAGVLSFPVLMVRQNVEGLLDEAFRIIDSESFAERRVIEIKPELMFPSGSAQTPAHAAAVGARRQAKTLERP